MKKLNYFASAFLLGIILCGAGCSSKKEVIEPEGGVLINGVVWAKCNVGAPGTFAAKPEDPGMFYQWNRKVGWSTTGNPPTSSPASQTWNSTGDTGDTWATENDPCPPGWRVPTMDELQEFVIHANWTQENGVGGYRYGSGTNTIFLPAVGHRSKTGALQDEGTKGCYWNNEPWVPGSNYAQYILFTESTRGGGSIEKSAGCSVRCVKK